MSRSADALFQQVNYLPHSALNKVEMSRHQICCKLVESSMYSILCLPSLLFKLDIRDGLGVVRFFSGIC
jgi:hypothetical protein